MRLIIFFLTIFFILFRTLSSRVLCLKKTGAGTRDPAPIKNPVLQGVGSKSKFCKLRTLHSFMGCS